MPLHRLALFALATLSAATPAMAQRVVNAYDLQFPFGDETLLVSELQSSLFGTRNFIAYIFISGVRDGLVNVRWEDRHGVVLLEGASNQLQVFPSPPPPGSIAAIAWSKSLGAFFPAPTVQDGTADFNGSVSINRPCTNQRCPAQYLEPTPLFPQLAAPSAGRGATATAAAATVVGETGATLALRAYAASPASDPVAAYVETELASFSSVVEHDGASTYTYTYTVSNRTAVAFDVQWAAAGLASGRLEANASISRSFSSSLAPTSVAGLATVTLGGAATGGGMDLLTPVPEPSRWLLALCGGVLLFAVRSNTAQRAGMATRIGKA